MLDAECWAPLKWTPVVWEGRERHWPGSRGVGQPHRRAPRWSWQTCWRWWAPWALARSALCSGRHNSCPHTPPYLVVWLGPGRSPLTVVGLAIGQSGLCRDHSRGEQLTGSRPATLGHAGDILQQLFLLLEIFSRSINHQSVWKSSPVIVLWYHSTIYFLSSVDFLSLIR